MRAAVSHRAGARLYPVPQPLTSCPLSTGRLDLQQADESLALAWENCSAAREELGDQRPEVRRAVALARCLLDPLAVLASLCGEPPLRTGKRSTEGSLSNFWASSEVWGPCVLYTMH